MPTQDERINKIFLRLQSDGSFVLDKEYLYDGCDTPELDPSIEMPAITIRKLAELVRSRNLAWPEKGEAEKLKHLLKELRDSADIVETTISEVLAEVSTS